MDVVQFLMPHVLEGFCTGFGYYLAKNFLLRRTLEKQTNMASRPVQLANISKPDI